VRLVSSARIAFCFLFLASPRHPELPRRSLPDSRRPDRGPHWPSWHTRRGTSGTLAHALTARRALLVAGLSRSEESYIARASAFIGHVALRKNPVLEPLAHCQRLAD